MRPVARYSSGRLHRIEMQGSSDRELENRNQIPAYELERRRAIDLPQFQTQPRLADRLDAEAWRAAILAKLSVPLGRDAATASDRDWFLATALAVRDRIAERWSASEHETAAAAAKRVYYLSIEYMIGRLLFDALVNLGLVEPVRAALAGLGIDFERVRDMEADAALGNGG